MLCNPILGRLDDVVPCSVQDISKPPLSAAIKSSTLGDVYSSEPSGVLCDLVAGARKQAASGTASQLTVTVHETFFETRFFH
jgi:hypothetical protein